MIAEYGMIFPINGLFSLYDSSGNMTGCGFGTISFLNGNPQITYGNGTTFNIPPSYTVKKYNIDGWDEIKVYNEENNMPNKFVETKSKEYTEKIGENDMNKENAMTQTVTMDKIIDMMTELKNQQTENVVSSFTKEDETKFGKFGKTSKFYGKELCGFMYNPFMVRRFLPKQFRELMIQDSKHNVDKGIKRTVSLMDSVYYIIEECHKLSYMDDIAYQERSLFWTVSDVKRILVDYLDKVQIYIDQAKERAVKITETTDEYGITKKARRVKYIKFQNKKYDAHVDLSYDNKTSTAKIIKELVVDWDVEKNIAELKNKITECNSYKEIWHLMEINKKSLIKLPKSYRVIHNNLKGDYKLEKISENRMFTLSKEFLLGYKLSGAYYTLKDEIMFGNRTYHGLTGRDALVLLRNNLENGKEAHEFYGELKDMYGYPVHK